MQGGNLGHASCKTPRTFFRGDKSFAIFKSFVGRRECTFRLLKPRVSSRPKIYTEIA